MDRVSTGGEISGAEIEVARENGPLAADPVTAAGEIPGEITDLATPIDHSVEARAEAEAAGSTEQELPSTSESERTPEAAFSVSAPQAEPVEAGTEKSSTPRRGWWQRLIQP
jgi:hypothetical protein